MTLLSAIIERTTRRLDRTEGKRCLYADVDSNQPYICWPRILLTIARESRNSSNKPRPAFLLEVSVATPGLFNAIDDLLNAIDEEWKEWRQLCEALQKIKAVTPQDLESSVSKRDTPGQTGNTHRPGPWRTCGGWC